jgi:ribokinase
MTRNARVVVIGSINTDMVVKMPRIPLPGETIIGGDFVMTRGGKGANQAVAAARLGADVTFVGRVGEDVFGERAVSSMRTAGVDTSCVTVDYGTPSGVALIFVGGDGQNSIAVAPGANSRLAPEHVDAARAAIKRADVVVLQLEMPMETVERAVEVADEVGALVVLNPAPAAQIPERILRLVDVLTPNEFEAATMLGRAIDNRYTPAFAARDLLAMGVQSVVLTLGSEGAVCATEVRTQEIPGKRVRAVDATGAGDCFTGALACAIGEGKELSVAVHFANAAAAVSVTRMGAQASMPTREEVEASISHRPKLH